MTRRLVTKFLVTAILVWSLAGHAAAQTAVQHVGSTEDFRVVVVPFYAWLTGMSGTLGVKGNQSNFDYSFADMARWVNLAATGHVEVIYQDRLGMLGEFNYAWLGDQNTKKNLTIDRQTYLALTDVAAFYRFPHVDLGDSGSRAFFDLLAGVRIWDFALHMNVNTGLGTSTGFQQATWADPIVGARALIDLPHGLLLEFRGGVGGFGVSSAFTWDAMGLLGWTFWDRKDHGDTGWLRSATVLAGYRAVGDTYDKGSGANAFKYHATLNGPVMGVAFVF
jgi:hypothetical protein